MMGKKSFLQLIMAWLKTRKWSILLFTIIVGMYWLVLWAYQIPYEVVSYCHFLAVIIFTFAGGIDFYRFIRKYNSLLDLYDNIEWSMQRMLCSPHEIEAAYQKVVKKLYEHNKILRQTTDNKLLEMNDYYTLWAHQIKTPIAAMHLLLEDAQMTDEMRYQLEMELFRIEQYAEMVLQYLRLESMASDMVIKSYDLYEIVKASIKKYAKSFISRKISLSFEPFETSVLSDEKWLTFVIEQLLSNSLKYTQPGGKVSIIFEEDALKKEKRLLIKDTGIGIHEEDLPRVFDRGFTGFNGRMDKHSTGIGLYLCKKITTQLAHGLTITSKVKEGTTVCIIFKEES